MVRFGGRPGPAYGAATGDAPARPRRPTLHRPGPSDWIVALLGAAVTRLGDGRPSAAALRDAGACPVVFVFAVGLLTAFGGSIAGQASRGLRVCEGPTGVRSPF